MDVPLYWKREIPALNIGKDLQILREVLKNPSAFLLKLSCMAGDIAAFSAGPVRLVLVNDPNLITSILLDRADEFGKMPVLRSLHAFTGEGLLISEGALWAKHRKLTAPAFHHRRIQHYQHSIAELIDATQAGWRDGQIIDIGPMFKTLTLQVIGKTLFSVDLNQIAAGFADDIELALNFVNRLAGQAAFPLARWFMHGRRGFKQAMRRIDELIYALIRQRRAEGQDHGDLLSMLMLSETTDGQRLSDREVRDEAITMFVAGHETIATVLTWLYYLLADSPETQTRLEGEARLALQGRPPAFDDLAQLPLAMQVYKEAMRLYPGGFTIGRQAKRDVDIGGYVIPAQSWVMVSPYSVHRNPTIFAEPEAFVPDRFLPEREKALPRGAYLPFGLGPRVCIGNAFALMEGQTIVAHLAQRVRLHRTSDTPVGIAPMIALNPDRPILMRVERV